MGFLLRASPDQPVTVTDAVLPGTRESRSVVFTSPARVFWMETTGAHLKVGILRGDAARTEGSVLCTQVVDDGDGAVLDQEELNGLAYYARRTTYRTLQKEQRCLPFDNLTTGCAGRAHFMAQAFIASGYDVRKVFLKYEGAGLSYQGVSWDFHVAPMVRLDQTWWVIDPTISQRPLSQTEWIGAMTTATPDVMTYDQMAEKLVGGGSYPQKDEDEDEAPWLIETASEFLTLPPAYQPDQPGKFVDDESVEDLVGELDDAWQELRERKTMAAT